ncbi:hypothetical protein EU803_04345 [Loktanella sp. IMCC34160]|uniref:tetratricopeptide repeat protein n=1 Tax=Loktanella sp. IMCC34160 TaxID=2510646 RepID=UPI00101B8608|nr:hypothetical protein [Loktanella sp. IMCC34160]RYG93335.1 hypothetical protein EU803_04345 [Loktanella sp. IMCC34160]
MAELPDDIYDRVTELSTSGNVAIDRGDFGLARDFFEQALTLLPPRQSDWSAFTWLWAAIGDTYFLEANWDSALGSFLNALNGPDAIGNPFLHLRLGQSYFETGQKDRALDNFIRAYLSEGADIFREEEPRYFAFLQEQIDI